MYKNVMTTRSRQRVTKMATVSVNMERYNEDEVGVSVWACPIYGGGRVVWCGPCLRLRVGVSSCVGGGVVGSAEGREEVVTHQLTAHTARVNSHAHTKRHTCVTTHDKVIHVTFTHTQ